MSNITYPNQTHSSTQPLITGLLERKSRALGGLTGYKSAFYVVTPSKYLHQFEDDDNFRKEPTSDLSLYLPDCTIGALVGEKFNIKGKDQSKGRVGSVFQTSHELTFKAPSPAEAQKWYQVISEAAGASNLTEEVPSPSTARTEAPQLQTQGIIDGKGQQSAEPQSAVSAKTPQIAVPQSAVTQTPVAQSAVAQTPVAQSAVIPSAATAGESTSAAAKETAA
jgi:hypothetical protein